MLPVVFSVFACIAVNSAVSESAPATRPAPAKIDWAQHYYDRVTRFRQENAAARNIVMVGSSHIERFNAAELLPGRRVINRGIASDRIGIEERGILHRLDSSVFDCNPGLIILENGVNDLGELWRHGKPSVDEIDACYRNVVRTIRERLPETPLIIVGLFPTRERYADLQPLIVKFNSRLATIAAEHGCPFMDAYTPFADEEGELRKEYSRDGLHLNEAGYRLWAKMLDKAIQAHDAPQPPTSQPADKDG